MAALVLALAVPVARSWMVRKHGRSDAGARRFLFPAVVVLAVLFAGAGATMIARGSAESAVGDIGGMALWLLSTAGLLGLSLAVIGSGQRPAESPSPRDA
ncbi:hypothetical protein [Paeniglutamicibacter sp. NPDC091659]|uniref:hypothetical protein n=1 Tax=Paeniglutamicibacter sp. NPDC091659 TaxID=3364389 RepID=UPI0038240593